ncbi:MAG: hypothetical protein LBU14_06755 [Candidatus Peribacteria bacterium]|nr:hypothetical protein [Candidatus Peribacteria bacterium]
MSAGRRKLDNSYENTLKQALNDETFESATFSFNQVRMAIRRAIRQDY